MSENALVVVGSLNLDLVAAVPHLPRAGETVGASSFAALAGGKGANQAVAAARLGASVAMVGRVGADGAGERLRAELAGADVRTEAVRVDPEAPTGTALICVDPHGDNTIVVVPGANARVDGSDLAAAAPLLAGAAFLLLQLEIPAATVTAAVAAATAATVRVMFNPAPALPFDRGCLPRVEVLVVNEIEAAALLEIDRLEVADAPEAARRLLGLGPAAVALTLGPDGSVIAGPEGVEQVPAYRVAVVDATAAGDAYIGGLVVGLLEGRPLREAARLGTAAAALAVGRAGAQASLPTRAEVERFLAAHPSQSV